MDWKKLMDRVIAPLRRRLRISGQQVDTLIVPQQWVLISGSNPFPFVEGATIRFRRLVGGANWTIAVRQPGESDFVVLGNLNETRADIWSGRVTFGDDEDHLTVALTPRLVNREGRFLFGIVLDDAPIQQVQGTWGAEEEV